MKSSAIMTSRTITTIATGDMCPSMPGSAYGRGMAQIHLGRHSASIEGDFVVFLIGARLNRPWKLRHLPWFARTMPRMLEELEQEPDAGLLAYQQGWFFGGPAVVQYWRSFEHLERYARNPDN